MSGDMFRGGFGLRLNPDWGIIRNFSKGSGGMPRVSFLLCFELLVRFEKLLRYGH